MTREEYETIQARLSKLIAPQTLRYKWISREKEEQYRQGVLAAKSVVKEIYEHDAD